jgi:two-component system, LytTR family, response regulator
MKIVLIDNETDVRETLHKLIEQIHPSRHDVQQADGVSTGISLINTFQPDVVFLDVEMDDGTGFDLLRKLNAPNFQLIFTTAFNQYAVQAFKFSAIDYLMKPVNPIELANALLKASEKEHEKNLQRQLDVLLQQVSGKSVAEKQIVLKDMDTTYFVKVSDILYCMAEGAYTQVFIQNSDPILVSRNLHVHEELLTPSGFIRSHHSCLVNPSHIKLYDRKTESLVLTSGHTVPISQRKRESVIEYLEAR